MNPHPQASAPDDAAPRPYGKLLAGIADHRDTVLRRHLLARHRLATTTLHEAEDEVAARHRRGERCLLEEVLLAAGAIDETDVASAFAASEAAPTEGSRYELGKRLGEGATGVVYRARDRVLGRYVAIKVLKPGWTGTADAMHGEGAALARLQHPNLVTVFDAGVLDGQRFLATEWVAGTTLAELLGRREHGLRELVQCVVAAARGLGAAHRFGVVHRDVKPGNILVDAAGVAKVCDFGLAITADADHDAHTGRHGTPRFMAPEQLDPRAGVISAPTDVYGLGAVLYQVLTGVPPFAQFDGDALDRAVLGSEPLPPHRLVRVPRDLSAIAAKALARAPRDRYRDGDDFAADLDAWLHGGLVRARVRGPAARACAAVRRHPVRALAAAAATLAAITVLVSAWFHAERQTLRANLNARMQETAELGLDAVLRLRRAGDLPGMSAMAQAVERACGDVLQQFPDEAGPQYVLGRVARATMRFPAALAHQEAAARLQPDDSRIRYERGILRLNAALLEQRYRREEAQRDELWRGASGWAKARHHTATSNPDDLDHELVRLAADDLRASGSPFGVALAAALQGRVRQAPFDISPDLAECADDEEVFTWLAMAALRRGDADAAIRWSTQGHERDRGYAPHLLLRATASWRRLLLGAPRDAAGLQATYAAIDSDLARAAALQPDAADLQEQCGVLYLLAGGEARALAPALVSEAHDRAIACLERAARLAPSRPELLHGVAIARLDRASQRGRTAIDAGTELQRAGAELAQAIALDDNRAAFWESLGHVRLAELRATRNRDERRRRYEGALAAFGRAAELVPGHFGPRIGRAMSYQLGGEQDLAVAELEAALAEMPASRSVFGPMLARLRR